MHCARLLLDSNKKGGTNLLCHIVLGEIRPDILQEIERFHFNNNNNNNKLRLVTKTTRANKPQE